MTSVMFNPLSRLFALQAPTKSPMQRVSQAPTQAVSQSPLQGVFQTPMQSPTQSPIQSPVQTPIQSPPMKTATPQPFQPYEGVRYLTPTSYGGGGGGGGQPQYSGVNWTAENHTGGNLSAGLLPNQQYQGAMGSGGPTRGTAAQQIAQSRRLETSRDVAFGMNAQSNDRYGKIGGTSGRDHSSGGTSSTGNARAKSKVGNGRKPGAH